MLDIVIIVLLLVAVVSFGALMALLCLFLWKVIKEEFKDGN